MVQKILIGVLTGSLLTACSHDTPAPDVADFRQLNQQLLTEVDTHSTNAAAVTDVAKCSSERDRYEAAARPLVDRMRTISFEMDDCMMAMGRTSLADMQTTCRGMTDELTTHREGACASNDLAQDKAELERHCSAMRGLIQHDMDRSDNMMQGGHMMSGMMSGGTCHD